MTAPRADLDELGRLTTVERHKLAACWNDADGNHYPARWDEVLWKVEGIVADRQSALLAEVAELRETVAVVRSGRAHTATCFEIADEENQP